MENTPLPRFDAKWRDPECEHIDCMHLLDAAWNTKPTTATRLEEHCPHYVSSYTNHEH
jgi:hypothetical protein